MEAMPTPNIPDVPPEVLNKIDGRTLTVLDRLPAYAIDGIASRSVTELEALATYCQVLAEHKDRPIDPAALEDDDEVLEVKNTLDDEDRAALDGKDIPGGLTSGSKHKKKIDCGPGCDGCPHGPYWYLSYRDEKGESTTEYIRPVGEGE